MARGLCWDVARNGQRPGTARAPWKASSVRRHSIKLLTLHAAKGRQFDAVSIIELNRVPHPKADPEEARRVLYVGITRPRKVLTLVSDRAASTCPFLEDPIVKQLLSEN